MDCFFASVEVRDKPYLRDLPVVVGGDPEGGKGRGVIATANYPARTYGLHSAMPLFKAWKLSEEARKKGLPPVTFISGSFHKYTEASEEVFALIRSKFKLVEQIGIDEGYIDCTHLKNYTQAAKELEKLKRLIRTKAGLPCSIGIAPTKMMAKIASDRDKPDGLCVLTPTKADALLPTLPVSYIPGIGRKSEEFFKRKGITTVGEARALSFEALAKEFGSHGFSFYERFLGIDNREVEAVEEDPKSIGSEETLHDDIHALKAVLPILERQSEKVHARMKKHGFSAAKTVSVVIRLADFSTFTRAVTPTKPALTVKEISTLALKLVLPFFDKRDNKKGQGIRLVGVRLSNFAK
jgi:nucleotidyltransferase/DNA polymerase involved in DNA repair